MVSKRAKNSARLSARPSPAIAIAIPLLTFGLETSQPLKRKQMATFMYIYIFVCQTMLPYKLRPFIILKRSKLTPKH